MTKKSQKNQIILFCVPEFALRRLASKPSLTSDMCLAVDSASTGDRFCEIYIILLPYSIARRVGVARLGWEMRHRENDAGTMASEIPNAWGLQNFRHLLFTSPAIKKLSRKRDSL